MAARLLAFHMSGGPPYGLRLQGGLNDSPFVIAKVSGRVYIICKNYFATAGLNDTVFTVFLPPNPDRLVTCTLDNVGTTLSYQTSNMIVINVTLLLVHFFTMSKFYVCFMSTCVYCMNCFFVDNVVRDAFLFKHIRLSRVFYNKLTCLLYKKSYAIVTEETFRRHLKTFLFNCLDN